ncbi:hypothetical protein [Rhizorhabdus phycosphaerae]|uniref:hypothetical protein n=1 Tax=Rhizorhabdus phycosphaerae TaxID=2711156 RepID=UPI0013EA8449|nr:hypothetical protein [Rhizorhabdus phycosphaerae]
MKLLPLLIALAAWPSALVAQGLPIDFDAEAIVAEKVQRDAAAAAARDEAAAAARPVRLGDRRPLHPDEAPAPLLPSEPGQPEG